MKTVNNLSTMNPNQLKQIIGTVIDGLEGQIKVLSNEIESIKETMPTIDNVLANVEIKTPKYGEDWSFSEDEMQEIMNEIRPQEGIDYFMPKDGKDAEITDELIERISGIVQSRVKNGKDGKDGRNGIDAITPEKGVDYFDGEDGKDGSPDTPKEIATKINTLENEIDWKVLKNFDSLVNQDTLKRAIQTLENQTRYLLQKTGTSGGGGGGTPGTPLNSVQYNLAGAFAGDSNFTRVSATQETILYKQMTDPNVVTGLNLTEDLLGLGLLPGAAIISTNPTSNIDSLQGVSDLSGIFGSSVEGIVSGTFNTATGDNLLITGAYITSPTVPTSGIYYNATATTGLITSDLILSPAEAKFVFADGATDIQTIINATATASSLTYTDTVTNEASLISALNDEVKMSYTPDGTNIYKLKVQNNLLNFSKVNTSKSYLDIDLTNDEFRFGDTNTATNGNYLLINNAANATTFFTPSFEVKVGSNTFLSVNSATGVYQLGDMGNTNNNCYLSIDDTNNRIDIKTGTTAAFSVNGTSKIAAFITSGGSAKAQLTLGNQDTPTAPIGGIVGVIANTSATNGAGANLELIGGAGSGSTAGGSVIVETFVLGALNSGPQSTTQNVVEFDYRKSAIFSGRVQEKKGADVTAANDLALGFDGNTFVVTGNTQINGIATNGWQAGSHITLIFTGTPTVKHNTAASAGFASMYLHGSADLVAANNTVAKFVYDGSVWQQECPAKVA